MAVKLVVGSVARLKSGGPWMTVTKDRTDQGSKFVQVSWFDGSTLSHEIFPKDALEPKDVEPAAAE